MESLKEMLDGFAVIDGVKGAILTDADGFVVEKTFEVLEEMPHLDAFLRELLVLGAAASKDLTDEALSQSYVEFSDFNLTCVVVEPDFLLTIVGGAGVNLGRIRLEVKKNKKKIESVLLA